MTKQETEAAIKVAKGELTRLTHETLRPHQGFKMRTHGPTISSIITAIKYWEIELTKFPTDSVKADKRKED